MGKHAFLSPSGASRWLECTPSARLEEPFKKNQKSNDAADEGTLAHALSELLFKKHHNLISSTFYNAELKKIRHNKFYNAQMMKHCTDYVHFLNELIADYDKPVFLTEGEVDLSMYVKECFGTCDFRVISTDTLHIVDLKYGKGVEVKAEKNKQLMLYALGALETALLLHDSIQTVKMTIYQPRLDNYSTYELTVTELLDWGNEVVKPKAALAYVGKGDLTPGDHCLFCKVKHQCRALADFNMSIASDIFPDPNILTDEEIAKIIEKADTTIKWLNSMKAHALHEAVVNGKKYPGLKVVLGRSNRVITDPAKVIEILKKAKIKNSLYLSEPALLTIGVLERNIGSGKLNELIGNFVIKPQGKPALVPEWHKSQAINSNEMSKLAFADVPEEQTEE